MNLLAQLENIPQPVRARIYRIALALVTLAGLYSIIGEDKIAGWTALVTAVFGNALATANTHR